MKRELMNRRNYQECSTERQEDEYYEREKEREILIDLEGRMRNDINLIIVSGGT